MAVDSREQIDLAKLPAVARQDKQGQFAGQVRLPAKSSEPKVQLVRTSQTAQPSVPVNDISRHSRDLHSVDTSLARPSTRNLHHHPHHNNNDELRKLESTRSVPVTTKQTSKQSLWGPSSGISSRADLLTEIRLQVGGAKKQGYMKTHVNSILLKVHETDEESRSEALRIFLAEMETSQPNSNPIPGTNDRVYVDASAIGIGFLFSDQWQAWRLKPGWMAVYDEEKEYPIRLAEAIAIELGVRLMIEKGARHIVMRSDNLPVVEAILHRSTDDTLFGRAVKHTLDVCHQYDVRLDILWIPGEINPADGPSRLRVGTKAERFRYDIDIPSHLQPLVLPYVSPL
ncbi:hypothetical protein AN958_07414 [Leucoagaricus sp. SymC.cos]|nr:hypothetical protein AN958_07414 [Leucoagaricus sp. SymC.cos]